MGGLNLGKVILEEVDEAVGGGVVGVDLCGVLQLSLNLLGELFAQFDPNRGETMGSGISQTDEPCEHCEVFKSPCYHINMCWYTNNLYAC